MSHTSLLSDCQKEQYIHEGYTVVSGLIPPEVVQRTIADVYAAAGIVEADPTTWTSKYVLGERAIIDLTIPCRTDIMEQAISELIGPTYIPKLAFSPFAESQGHSTVVGEGFIPVLRFPEAGEKTFKPIFGGRHIDGIHRVTTYPSKNYMVLLVYLTDVTAHGGALAVWPGAHRKVLEHWVKKGAENEIEVPDLDYGDPVPVAGKAGDLVLMHYLMPHSSSYNFESTIRFALNSAVLPDENNPYVRKPGPPQPNWTPLDYSLRTDNF